MVKKQKEVNHVEELIKETLSKKNLTIGFEVSEKSLKNNELRTIIVSTNFEEIKKKHIEHLCKISEIEYIQSEMDAKTIGELCKKPFLINVVGIKK